MAGLGTGLSFVLFIGGVILAVSWIAIPFVIFKIKSLLEQILHQLKRLNEK